MSKSEETKQKILKQAAELFNQQGYDGASMSDIVRVTGLQKGGIYNHLKSKDALACEAFDYAIACVSQQYGAFHLSEVHYPTRPIGHPPLTKGRVGEGCTP